MKKYMRSRTLKDGRLEITYKVLDIGLDHLLECEKVKDVIMQLTEWSEKYGESLSFDYEACFDEEQWFLYMTEVETDEEYQARKDEERQEKERKTLERQRRREENERNRIRNEELRREERYQKFLELQKEFGE